MSSAQPEIVIIRRVDPEEDMVKGGVWKIAHADFMTAMMAFFLVMWLISQTDEATRNNIANYFNPVNLTQAVSDEKGLSEPQNIPAETKAVPGMMGKEKGSGEGAGGQTHQMRKPRFKEGALFQDPYAVLAKIAAEIEPLPQHALGADLTTGESETPGLPGGESYRDPFDPLYWQISPVPQAKGNDKPRPGTAPTPGRASIDALAATSQREAGATKNERQTKPAEAVMAQPAKVGAKPSTEADAPKERAASKSDQDLAALKSEITEAVRANRNAASPNIEVRRTGAGTLISLTDDFNFSMFAIGSSEPDAKVVSAMAKVAKILKTRPGNVVLRGHTDGRPFKSENYDNWRLSQSRAQMALYMLVRGGLPEERIVRVEGHAAREPRNAANINADENRRIEILIQE